MSRKGIWLLIVLVSCLCRQASAQTPFIYLTGSVVDEHKAPAPFVNIIFRDNYFQEWVISDVNGRFTIRLKPNKIYSVTVNDSRYKHFSVRLHTGPGDFRWVLDLDWRKSNMTQAYNQADTTENLANRVIKESIRKRNFLAGQVNAYSVDAHLNSSMEVTKVKSNYPRWWLWTAVPDSSQRGVNNLVEVYSRVYVRNHPSAYREEVKAMRRAGRELDLDFTAHFMLQMNFYENTVQILKYNEMPYISPLSWGAFVFYKYKMIETYRLDGELIYRIQVTPKNKYNRTFRGEIHIASRSHSLVKVDLTAPKSSGLQKVDSVNIRQDFIKTKNNVWMPSYIQVVAWNQLYGASILYHSDVTFANYDFRPVFYKGFFSQQLVNADTSDLKYDPEFWKKTPGYHVSREQENFLINHDSISQLQRCDPHTLDSLCSFNRKNNFHWLYPIFGHTSYNNLKQELFYYDGLINDKMEYNTVEGFTYKYTVYYRKKFRNGWQIDLEPTARFGFADLRPKGKLYIGFENEFHAQKYRIEGGSYYFQINQSEPIDPIINSFYTLVLRRNFMKLYRKEYIKFSHERELINGLYFYGSAEFASRSTVENATDWSLIRWPGVDFTPNNPNAQLDSNYRLSQNNAFKIKIGFTYKPKQRYMRFGRRKVILGSLFPAVSLFYTKGIPWVFGSQVNYDLLELTITHDLYFKLIGKSSYILKGGIYLNRGRMTFLDYTHFIGERGFFLGSAVNGTYLDQFRALDYFAYSTNYPFVEIHYQHDFKGFLLSQVPGIKLLKWNPLVGVNYLQIFDPAKRSYLEVFFGLGNLLGAIKPLELFDIRVDVAMQLKDGVDVQPQFLVGISTKFGQTP